MSISSISVTAQKASIQYSSYKSQSSTTTNEDGTKTVSKNVDAFVKSAEYSSANVTYAQNSANGSAAISASGANISADSAQTSVSSTTTDDKKTDKLNVDQLMKMEEQRINSFKNMISSMFKRQGITADKAKGQSLSQLFSSLTVTPEEQAKAASAISEDGEWGVNAVSTRLMDMAMALSGGDSSKAGLLREAVKKGFEQAGVEWGSSLPSVSQNTYTEVMKRFDYWEANGSMDGYQYQSYEN